MKDFPYLKTERLFFTPLRLSDAEVILFMRSDPEVNKYIPREPSVHLSQATDFIKMIRKNFEDGISTGWGLRLQKDGDLIGSICLWNFSEDRKTAELGYDLHPRYQGKGLMSEAVKEIIKYGFDVLKLDQIEAFTHQHYDASIRVLQNNGFQLNENRKDDEVLDNLIFELKEMRKD